MKVTAAIDKHAALTTKVAAMTPEQRWVRMQELSRPSACKSEESELEFAKLLLGPDATISDYPSTHEKNPTR